MNVVGNDEHPQVFFLQKNFRHKGAHEFQIAAAVHFKSGHRQTAAKVPGRHFWFLKRKLLNTPSSSCWHRQPQNTANCNLIVALLKQKAVCCARKKS